MTNTLPANGRQQQATTQTQTQPPSADFERLLNKPNERAIEYVPFGSTDKIKLTVDLVQKFCAVRTKTGQTCSVRDAIRFMMMCQSQRLNPFANDAYLTGYDGKDGPIFSLITAEGAFNKRAENCKEFDGIEYGIIVEAEGVESEIQGEIIPKGAKLVGGWCRVHRKDRAVQMYDRLDVSKYKPNYQNPFWENNPAHQIAKCARVAVLRRTFPTMLGGLYLDAETGAAVGVSFEMPSNLVEVRGAPHRTDNAPEPDSSAEAFNSGSAGGGEARPIAEPSQEKPSTVQTNLAKEVTEAGFSFSDFQKCMAETGTIGDASSFGSFDDIPTEACKRVLTALRGAKSRGILINALTQAKGQLV